MTADIVNLSKVRRARERAIRERGAREPAEARAAEIRTKASPTRSIASLQAELDRARREERSGGRRRTSIPATSRNEAGKALVLDPGHRTSVSLEKAFWLALKEAAAEDGVTLASLINSIDEGRGEAGLSSAVASGFSRGSRPAPFRDEAIADLTAAIPS